MSSTTTEKRVYERERERERERRERDERERERVIGRKEGATRKLVSSTAQLLQFDLRIFWAETNLDVPMFTVRRREMI